MKKIILMLAVVMSLAFVACGGRQAQTVEATADVDTVEVVETCACCAEDADTTEVVETVVDEVVDAE